MFTLCYYAEIMLPLKVYYADINFKSLLCCYYDDNLIMAT